MALTPAEDQLIAQLFGPQAPGDLTPEEQAALGGGGTTTRGVITTANGRRVLLDPSTGDIIRDLGPETPTAGPRSVEDEIRIRQTPSISSSTSQSLADPRTLALQQQQLAENARQFDITNARATETANATLAQQREVFEYTKTKDAYAREVGDKELALKSQAQMFQQQQAITAVQLQIAGLNAQREVFNAQMQQQVAQANNAFRNDAANREAQANRDVVAASQQPSDFGKVAQYELLNKPGQGAVGEQDFRTDESLAPLQTALNQRATSQREQAATPYQFTPLEPLNVPGINLNAITQAPQSNGVPQLPTSAQQPTTGEAFTDRVVGGDQSALGALIAQGFKPAITNANGQIPAKAEGGIEDRMYISGEDGPELNIPLGGDRMLIVNAKQAKALGLDLNKIASSRQTGDKPAMFANGGIFDPDTVFGVEDSAPGDMYSGLGADARASLGRGKGGTYRGQQVRQGGFNSRGTYYITPSGQAVYADQLDAATGYRPEVTAVAPPDARQFLDESFNKALARTPWAAGGRKGLPSPVYASSPGTSPIVSGLLAGLSGLGGMLPTDEYLRQSRELAPTAVTQRIVGRNA